jgi:hypothetical protein
MSSNRVNRHLARKEKLNVFREVREELEPYRISTTSNLENVPSHGVLSEFKRNQQEELAYFSSPVTVSTDEVNLLISEIQGRWNDEQMTVLLDSCKKSVLQSVVVPFGLGAIVAGFDKKGGNITTVHNAENNVFANKKDAERYNAEFDRKDYEDGGLGSKRKPLFQENDKVFDAYTGKEIPKDGRTHLDHVISAKEIHEDKLLRLSTEKQTRDKIATSKENLVPTDSSLNQSKNAHDLKAWMNTKRKDDKTNAEFYEIDPKHADDVYSTAKLNYQIEKTLAVSKHFGNELATTGTIEAGKMGLQQSIGLLLTEFFAATFDEISDAYKNGFKDSLKSQSFFEALRIRLNRISERVAARWKDALSAFKEGAISGFLSNLVAMLINALVTTGKRIVRVIREGFLSIMKALKMAIFPPEGITHAEASDAALKLLATGVTVSLGILAEEAVEKTVLAFFTTHLPLLAPFAPTVSAIFVGAMTGIASSLLVYGLDQLDVFGVNNQRKHEFVLLELDTLIAESGKNLDSAYENEMNRMENMLAKLQPA